MNKEGPKNVRSHFLKITVCICINVLQCFIKEVRDIDDFKIRTLVSGHDNMTKNKRGFLDELFIAMEKFNVFLSK